MATPDEFIDWIRGLPDPVVQLHDFGKATYRTIDLRTLAKDLHQHPDVLSWWKGKNMPRHLNNTAAQTILDLNPPENIRAAMIFLMM
jgi:hypothetical protein